MAGSENRGADACRASAHWPGIMSYGKRTRTGEGGGGRGTGGGPGPVPGKRSLTDRMRAPQPVGDDLLRPDFTGPRPAARGGDGAGDNLLSPDFSGGRPRAGGGDGLGDNTLAPDWSSRPDSGAGSGMGDELLSPDWDAEPLLDDGQIARASRRNPQQYTRLVFDPRYISDAELDSAEFAIAVAEQQRIHGLEVDGIVGPRTLAALGIAHGEAALPAKAVEAQPKPYMAPNGTLDRDPALSIEEHRATLPLDGE
jgi:peptidoglycan hydrolase-like protein with peptidoglycan-binding domain